MKIFTAILALLKWVADWLSAQQRQREDQAIRDEVQDDARLSDVTAALEAERRADAVPLRLPDSPNGVLPAPRKGRRE